MDRFKELLAAALQDLIREAAVPPEPGTGQYAEICMVSMSAGMRYAVEELTARMGLREEVFGA